MEKCDFPIALAVYSHLNLIADNYLKSSRCSPPKCRSDFWLGRIRGEVGKPHQQ